MDLGKYLHRAPVIGAILHAFESPNLDSEVKHVADGCADVATAAVDLISDHPQLTTGLSYLLSARDAFLAAYSETQAQGAANGTVSAVPTQPVPAEPTTPAEPQAPVQPVTDQGPSDEDQAGDSGGAGAALGTDPDSAGDVDVTSADEAPAADAGTSAPAAPALVPGRDHPITAVPA